MWRRRRKRREMTGPGVPGAKEGVGEEAAAEGSRPCEKERSGGRPKSAAGSSSSLRSGGRTRRCL